MNNERAQEILGLLHQHNTRAGDPPPLSPFLAQATGRLDEVAREVGVPLEELDTFLTQMSQELPSDHLNG